MGKGLNIVFFIFSCLVLSASGKKAENDKQKPLDTVDVLASPVQKTRIFDTLVFGGKFTAEEKFVYHAPVSGVMRHIFNHAGEGVKKNSRLISLEQIGVPGEFVPVQIKSRGAGVVSIVHFSQGDYVEKGRALLEVMNPKKMIIEFLVPPQDAHFLQGPHHLKVEFRSENGVEKIVPVKLLSVSKVIDPVNGMLQGTATLRSEHENFIDGAFAKVVLEYNQRDGVVVNLKNLYSNREQVLLMTDDGLAKWEKIKLGTYYGNSVEVLTGLKENQMLVTSFAKHPKDGQKLKLTEKTDVTQPTNKTSQPSANKQEPKKKG